MAKFIAKKIKPDTNKFIRLKSELHKMHSGEVKRFSQRHNPFFQPKLSVNQLNDADSYPYEQEADAMSDKVIGMKTPSTEQTFFSPPVMQRKESNNDTTEVTPETESYLSSLSGGKTLGNEEKSFFEPRMGYDFSGVKIHTDSTANESAKNINALAYTHGNNIVFGSNQYQPDTNEGKKLLAHELTHIMQQNEGKMDVTQRQPDDKKDAPSTKNNVGLQSGISDLADVGDWQEEDFHLKGDYLLKDDPRHPKVINYLRRAKLRIQSALANGLKWRFENINNEKVIIKLWSEKWELTLQERNTRLENLLTLIDKTIDLITNKDIPLLNNQWGKESVNSTIASAAFGPFFRYVEKIGITQKDAALLMAYIFSLTEATAQVKHIPSHLNYTGTGIYVLVPSVLTDRMRLKIITGFETARKGEIAGELLSDRFGRFIFYHDQRIYVNENNEVIYPHN
jgi:hypothetical protein